MDSTNKNKLLEENGKSSIDSIGALRRDVFTIPNLVTMIRAVGTVVLVRHLLLFGLAPMTIGIASPIVLPILASTIVLTDTLDGYLARKFNWQSKTGKILDTVVDKVFTWGVALSVLATGILPITSALLLAPILCNDLYIGYKTAKDKKETNSFLQDSEKNRPNDTSVHNNFFAKMNERLVKGKAYIDSNHMQPTVYGKLKMWGLSVALISGLAFGFTSNPLFMGTSLITGLICVKDSLGVNKRSKIRKKYRAEAIKGELIGEDDIIKEQVLSLDKNSSLSKVQDLPVVKKISTKLGLENRTDEEKRYVSYLLDRMINNPQHNQDTKGKELIKSYSQKK